MDFSYWYFFILALFGAVVANATGAGGGVVFVPAFTLLGLSPESIIATSFGIQCFGMTAGAFAWARHARSQTLILEAPIWRLYWWHVGWLSVPAVVGLLVGQYAWELESPEQVKWVFKRFSIVFAMLIFATTYYLMKYQRRQHGPIEVSILARCLYLLIGFGGGVLTAWLSVGVGELVAVALILMRYPVRMAIGVAVSVSAVLVWVGVQKYFWLEPSMNVNVLLFAAPAALIGGTVARYLVAYFSPVQLKLFIASWILFSALAM